MSQILETLILNPQEPDSAKWKIVKIDKDSLATPISPLTQTSNALQLPSISLDSDCDKMILITSDVHLSPGNEIPRFLIAMFREASETNARIIINGDFLNFLPYGLSAWETTEGHYTIQKFIEALPRQGCDYIFGNHEGNLRWLEDIFEDYPQVRVSRELNVFIGGTTWHFEHGHGFALDWSWLQWIADDLTQFMVKYAPGLWYWIGVKAHWIPSKIKDTSTPKYKEVIGGIWSRALAYAVKNNVNVVIGHTHTRANLELGTGQTVIDDGTSQVIRI